MYVIHTSSHNVNKVYTSLDSGILEESAPENIEDQKAVDIIHLYDLLEDPEERNDLK